MKQLEDFKIDFFCIGAGKCGSTWLATCLNEHPQVTIAKGKEPNFFVKKLSAFGGEINKNYMKDWEWYKSCFSNAKPNSIYGDMSVNLIHNIPEVPINIKKYFPNANFIVMLRDPVKRTYSHYWHERFRDRVKGVPKTFEEAIKNEELLFRSCYYRQLKEWFKVFPKDKFFIILDIDLKKNVVSVWKALCSFLNVDNSFIPPSLYKKVNEANKIKLHVYYIKKTTTFLRQANLDFVVDLLKKMRVDKVLYKNVYIKSNYPPMKPETEKFLRQYLLEDIEQLEKLINRNLDSWKICK